VTFILVEVLSMTEAVKNYYQIAMCFGQIGHIVLAVEKI
jgi:hypothetical protein